MATCKDCLHYHACVDMLKLAFPKTKEKEIEQTSTRENNCRNFKPTADVVPRARIAEIFGDIEKVIGEQYENYVFDNLDIEGAEQDAIIAFVDVMKRHFAELKKKHTEGGK